VNSTTLVNTSEESIIFGELGYQCGAKLTLILGPQLDFVHIGGVLRPNRRVGYADKVSLSPREVLRCLSCPISLLGSWEPFSHVLEACF
jgi:hypothetical protein